MIIKILQQILFIIKNLYIYFYNKKRDWSGRMAVFFDISSIIIPFFDIFFRKKKKWYIFGKENKTEVRH